MIQDIVTVFQEVLRQSGLFKVVQGLVAEQDGKLVEYRTKGEGEPIGRIYDLREGVAYFKMSDSVRIERERDLDISACSPYERRTWLLKVVCVTRRDVLVSDNAYIEDKLAANVLSLLSSENWKPLRTQLNAVTVASRGERYEVGAQDNLPINSLELASVAVYMRVEVEASSKCFQYYGCGGGAVITPVIEFTKGVRFTPSGGAFFGFVSVELDSLTEGASIYYTLDGSTPSKNSTLYTGAVVITNDNPIRAIAVKDGLLPSAITSTAFAILPLVVSLVPAAGQFLGGVAVELISNSAGGTIRYTLDGSDPTESSTLYTAPIQIGVNTEIRAINFNAPAAPSAIASAQFNIQALAPVVTPSTGTFENSRSVVFANPNPFGQVWASLNGGAFQVVGTETFTEITSYIAEVRFNGYVTSQQVSGTISIQCAAVTISPNGGEFINTTGEITLSTITSGAAIRLTTDGSEPTESSTLYNPLSKPTLTQSRTLRAKAFKANLIPSATTQASFIVLAKFALVGNAGSGTQRLYRSNNDGGVWTEVQPFGNESRVYIDSQISDNGASVLIVEGANAQNIRISKDTLQTWQTPTFPSTLVSSAIFRGTSDGGIFIACANIGNARNQILVSTDGGLNFVDRSPSLATFNGCEISPDGTTMYAFKSSISNLDNIIVYRSTDLGLNWTAVYTLANRRVTFASCSDEAAYFNVVTQTDAAAGIFRLPHATTVLTDLTTAIGSLGAVAATQRAISVSNDDSVLIAWSFAGVLTRRSTNQGTSFSSVNLTAANARRMNINNIGTKVIIGQTNSIINISTDGGQTYALPAVTPGTGSRTWQLADLN